MFFQRANTITVRMYVTLYTNALFTHIYCMKHYIVLIYALSLYSIVKQGNYTNAKYINHCVIVIM